MQTGKQIRLSRLINKKSNKSIFIPMDHGVTLGPITGLEKVNKTVGNFSCLDGDYIQGIVLQKGAFRHVIETESLEKNLPGILHLSASSSMSEYPSSKILVSSVEDAITFGADTVSIQMNVGVADDKKMLKDFGKVSSLCQRWGMPLLVMAYAFKNGKQSYKTNDIKLVARIASELGADFIKIPFPDSDDGIREIVDGTFSRVLIAGGEKVEDGEIMKKIRLALSLGIDGICIGRNIFQRNDMLKTIRLISEEIHSH